MKNYKNVSDFFDTRGPEDVERFIDKNLDISQQVDALIRSKGLTQKEFAKILNKSEAQVSKWLSGSHNLTLRSIAKMEAALDADIILTPLKAEKQYMKVEYVMFEIHANTNVLRPNNTNYKEGQQRTKQTTDESKIKAA